MDLKAFLRGNVRSDRFGHKYHVHMAFEVLRRTSFPTAAAAYSHALKLMAAQVGRPEAYHETITLAFLSIIGNAAPTQNMSTSMHSPRQIRTCWTNQ